MALIGVFMGNFKYKAAGFFLILLFFGLADAPLAQGKADDPVQSLNRLEEAIENGDSASFQELADLDAILNDCLEAFLREARKPENLASMPPLLALMFSQSAIGGEGGEKLRALLREEARAFVLNGVASGAFAGKKFSGARQSGMLAPLFANASMGRKEIRGIGEPRREGGGWLLPFSVHDYGNDQDYAIVGRFSPGENGPRLAGLQNMDALLRQIFAESRQAE